MADLMARNETVSSFLIIIYHYLLIIICFLIIISHYLPIITCFLVIRFIISISTLNSLLIKTGSFCCYHHLHQKQSKGTFDILDSQFGPWKITITKKLFTSYRHTHIIHHHCHLWYQHHCQCLYQAPSSFLQRPKIKKVTFHDSQDEINARENLYRWKWNTYRKLKER